MKITDFLFIGFILLQLNACRDVHCEVLYKSNGVHKVFQNPALSSKVKYEINNDTLNENYYILIVHKIRNGWAEITAYSPAKEYNKKGWVPLSDIGILIAGEPVLYKFPDKNSPITKIKDYDYGFLDILDCKSGWLKVKYANKTKVYEGWLPPWNQCANPYTTCN